MARPRNRAHPYGVHCMREAHHPRCPIGYLPDRVKEERAWATTKRATTPRPPTRNMLPLMIWGARRAKQWPRSARALAIWGAGYDEWWSAPVRIGRQVRSLPPRARRSPSRLASGLASWRAVGWTSTFWSIQSWPPAWRAIVWNRGRGG